MQPFISIVTPAYNSEQHLTCAADSVLAQTFRNFEWVIIDDASTDATGRAADELAKADRRIKVIHNAKNQWIYGSLNVGVQAAQGKYIYVLNSDDALEPFALEKAAELAEKSDADVVFTKTRVVYINGDKAKPGTEPALSKKITRDLVYTSTDEIHQNWPWIEAVLGNNSANLYRASIAKKHPFREDFYAADLMFNDAIADELKVVAVCADPVYLHYQYTDSNSNTTRKFYGYEVEMYNEIYRQRKELYANWGLLTTFAPELFDMRLTQLNALFTIWSRATCPLSADEIFNQALATCGFSGLYEQAAQLGKTEELEAVIIEGCFKVSFEKSLSVNANTGFLLSFFSALLIFHKTPEQKETCLAGISHPLNPFHLGKAIFNRWEHLASPIKDQNPGGPKTSYVLVGAGKRGEDLLLALGQEKVVAFADNKKRGFYCEKPVCPMADLAQLQFAHAIVIAMVLRTLFASCLDEQLVDLGVYEFCHYLYLDIVL